METCETCGADLEDGLGCARCHAIYERLGSRLGDAGPFREWLEDVITTRVRAFVAAGHLDEVIGEAFNKHENRYYHNRRPEY